jgi:AraC-like DNA-binding protein
VCKSHEYAVVQQHDAFMFRYISNGTRNYASEPISLRRRSTWEFEAVIQGRIAPILPRSYQIPCESSLWAFPPNTAHGWTGEPGRTAEVIVFHPLQVPQVLNHAAKAADREDKFLAIPLSHQDIQWLQGTYNAALQSSNHFDQLSPLRLERIILDISLLILDRIPRRWLPEARYDQDAMLTRVLAWLEDHLTEGAEIRDACKACGCSPAHLRRLFHTAYDISPRQALCNMRLHRADQLLADGSLGLDEVARLCGYADASIFCRTYRAQRGITARRMPRTGVNHIRPRNTDKANRMNVANRR